MNSKKKFTNKEDFKQISVRKLIGEEVLNVFRSNFQHLLWNAPNICFEMLQKGRNMRNASFYYTFLLYLNLIKNIYIFTWVEAIKKCF